MLMMGVLTIFEEYKFRRGGLRDLIRVWKGNV